MKAGYFYDNFFVFIKILEEKDLPANGEDPALKPIDIVGCGDIFVFNR